MSEIKKVVLAYSGGLDTSIIIPWLKENYGCEVICVAGNVGQDAELEGLEERAKKTGASKLYIEDLQDEFVNDYVFPTLKAGAVYEGKYLLGTSLPGRSSQSGSLKSPRRKAPMPSATAAPARATIRSGSSWPSRRWLPI